MTEFRDVHIVIIDEHNTTKCLFVNYVELKGNLFCYKTKEAWITMPLERLIKIKSKEGPKND